jgi:hypothetical protein
MNMAACDDRVALEGSGKKQKGANYGWISDLQPLAGIPGFGGFASCFGNRGSLSIVIS